MALNRSVERAIQLLETLAFDRRGEETTVTYLAERVGLPAPTVYRLLKTLEKYGLVQQDGTSRAYRLGPHLLTMGLQVAHTAALRREAIPIMARLADLTTEDCYLTVPDGYDGVFVEMVGGSQHLKIVERVGMRVPLHCGAARKVILAFMPPQFVEEYLRRPLKRFTDRTMTDPQQLREALQEIRRQGYGVTYGEYIAESQGIAAPVFLPEGQVVGSIGIILPAIRAQPQRIPGLVRAVVDAAHELSSRLGFRAAAHSRPGPSPG